jgi:Flp pilus assembly protein TadG
MRELAMMKRLSVRRFGRNTRAAAVIEFALVVPILFMLVWGIISFTRAYQRLNALTSSLREGARVASTMDSLGTLGSRRTTVRSAMHTFSSAFGFTIDTAQVTIDVSSGVDVRVRVVNYPIFSGLTFLGGLSGITVSREAVFRCERGAECGQ